MNKIDPVVKKETLYIFLFCLPLSLLMQSVFLILGYWDYTVLLGNLLGVAAATLHFLFLGLTLQNAIGKEEGEIKVKVKRSQSFRTFFLFLVALLAYLIPAFHLTSTVIPFLFPRIAIFFRPFLDRNMK